MEKFLKSSKSRPTQLNKDANNSNSQTSSTDKFTPSLLPSTSSYNNNSNANSSSKHIFFKRRFSVKGINIRRRPFSTSTTPDGCTSSGFHFKTDNNDYVKSRSAVTSPMSSSFENTSVSTTATNNSGSLSPTISKLLNCIPLKKFSNAAAAVPNPISVDLSQQCSSSSTSTTSHAPHHHQPPQQRRTTPPSNVVPIQENCANELQNSALNATDLFDFRRSGVYLGNETSASSSTKNAVDDSSAAAVSAMLKQKNKVQQQQFIDDDDGEKNKTMNNGNKDDKQENIVATSPSSFCQRQKNINDDDDEDRRTGDEDENKSRKPVFLFGSPPLSSSQKCRSNDDSILLSSPEEMGSGECGVSGNEESAKKLVEPVQVSSASSRYSTPSSSMSPKNIPPCSPSSSSTSNYYNGIKATEEQMRKLLRRSHSLANSDIPVVIDKDGRPVVVDVNSSPVGIAGSSPRNVSHPSLNTSDVAKNSDTDEVPPLTDSSSVATKKNSSNLKKKRSFAQPITRKLSFLRRRPTDTSLVSQTSETKPNESEIKNWALSFDNLLRNKNGVELFRLFLQREFSDENIEFWLACEEYKKIIDPEKLRLRAKQIYTDFVALQSPKEVNLDSVTRGFTIDSLANPTLNTFDQAQHRIQSLMAKDSYPRFLRADLYLDLLK